MIAALGDRAQESRELFVEHHRSKYSSPYMPPLWVVTELMTMGQLSKWLAQTNDLSLRKAIATDLGLPSREVLESTMQYLSYVRNLCAHHSRIWNRRMVKRLPLIKRLRADMSVILSDGQHQPDNRVYNGIVILARMLIHQSPDTSFVTRAKALVETRSAAQQRDMGFPDDWRDRPLWATKERPDSI